MGARTTWSTHLGSAAGVMSPSNHVLLAFTHIRKFECKSNSRSSANKLINLFIGLYILAGPRLLSNVRKHARRIGHDTSGSFDQLAKSDGILLALGRSVQVLVDLELVLGVSTGELDPALRARVTLEEQSCPDVVIFSNILGESGVVSCIFYRRLDKGTRDAR